jgi:hypothetical protein
VRSRSEKKSAQELFQYREQEFNPSTDAVEFKDGHGGERQIGTHQHEGTAGGDGEDKEERLAERFPE